MLQHYCANSDIILFTNSQIRLHMLAPLDQTARKNLYSFPNCEYYAHTAEENLKRIWRGNSKRSSQDKQFAALQRIFR
jgi:hypothetical protein